MGIYGNNDNIILENKNDFITILNSQLPRFYGHITKLISLPNHIKSGSWLASIYNASEQIIKKVKNGSHSVYNKYDLQEGIKRFHKDTVKYALEDNPGKTEKDFNFDAAYIHFDTLDKITDRTYLNTYMEPYVEGTKLTLRW